MLLWNPTRILGATVLSKIVPLQLRGSFILSNYLVRIATIGPMPITIAGYLI